MNISLGIIQATLLGGLIALVQLPNQGSGPAAPTAAQARDLEQQIGSLEEQLDQVTTDPDAGGRQQLMQQHWQGMQKYMGQMHDRWVMGYQPSLGYPWMRMSPGTMEQRISWPLPQSLTSNQYAQQMRELMKLMQEQMSKIAQAADPKERQRLMREHWRDMYRHIETMRGMGWMWSGESMTPEMNRGGMMQIASMPGANELPDSASADAELVSTYCGQCHMAPQPTLHTAKEWSSSTERMHIRMEGGSRGTKTPSGQEMRTIVAYMQRNARQ